jgi:vancomycin permeability regulator SanA
VLKILIKNLVRIALLLMIVLLGINAYIYFYPIINDNQSLKPRIAIVFGASSICQVQEGIFECRPRDILKARLSKTVELYKTGVLDEIIVSGDNKTNNYNEPLAMYSYLVQNGVPSAIITKDPLGLNTNDTCKRAKEVYRVNEAYLITNDLHSRRAMFICSKYRISSKVYTSPDPTSINEKIYNYSREFGANIKAVFLLDFGD